jgi:hypothetical protein
MRVSTKKLNVVLTAETLARALQGVDQPGLLCLMTSTSREKRIIGCLRISSLTIEHFQEDNCQMYLVSDEVLTKVGFPGYDVLYGAMELMHGYWYQEMMQIGAIHIPSSIEAVWLPMASSHLLAWREPNVSRSGLASVGRELRKEILRLSPEKALIPQSPGSTEFTKTVRSEAKAMRIIKSHGFLLNPSG